MKKLYIASFAALTCCLILLIICFIFPEKFENNTPVVTEATTCEEILPVMKNEYETVNFSNFKAIWLSQFDLNNVYSVNNAQRDKKDFEKNIEAIYNNVKEYGFNTVIVQLRPYGDSMYPSEFFCPSKYVTGSYSNEFTYDPVEIMVSKAHEAGLSFHAWINPLRCMSDTEIELQKDDYLIKKWYSDSEKNGNYISKVDNRFYLNPAYEEVRNLIIDGIEEIISLYHVDGIHIDDYFYPTTSAEFDKISFDAYAQKTGFGELKQFRFENLNALISGIYKRVKENNLNVVFGISPSGLIENTTEHSYTDLVTWCSNDGYVDYMCPQVYFGFEHQTCDFKKICDEWQKLVTNKNIKLYYGITLHKIAKTDQYAGSGKDEWTIKNDIIKRSLEYTLSLPNCNGIAIFSYQYMFDPITGEKAKETTEEINNFLPVFSNSDWEKIRT